MVPLAPPIEKSRRRWTPPLLTGSSPVLTTQKQIMYYIDIAGRLIYEMCNMKSEITGFDDDGLFHIILLWE